jgi:hypothetical protein
MKDGVEESSLAGAWELVLVSVLVLVVVVLVSG